MDDEVVVVVDGVDEGEVVVVDEMDEEVVVVDGVDEGEVVVDEMDEEVVVVEDFETDVVLGFRLDDPLIEIDEDVDWTTALVDDELIEADPNIYMFNRLPAPHISLELPAQTILQSF